MAAGDIDLASCAVLATGPGVFGDGFITASSCILTFFFTFCWSGGVWVIFFACCLEADTRSHTLALEPAAGQGSGCVFILAEVGFTGKSAGDLDLGVAFVFMGGGVGGGGLPSSSIVSGEPIFSTGVLDLGVLGSALCFGGVGGGGGSPPLVPMGVGGVAFPTGVLVLSIATFAPPPGGVGGGGGVNIGTPTTGELVLPGS